MSETERHRQGHGENDAFPPTRWTVVRQAQGSDEAISETALNQLCGVYWYPLFATARRRHGLDYHQAEDMVQKFWAWVLEKDHLAKAEPERGRFRGFLTSHLENFIRHDFRTMSAKKRGGGIQPISMDSEQWNARYEAEIGLYTSPDEHLDKVWERAGLEAAFRDVEAAWGRRGKGEIFEALKEHLHDGEVHGAAKRVSAQLGISEVNVRQHVFRLKKDLRAACKRWLGDRDKPESPLPS